MAAGEANPHTWGTWPSPWCHPDLPGLKEVHSARPLSVSRPLSLSPIITHMTDRHAFPFDGAEDFRGEPQSRSDDPPLCVWAKMLVHVHVGLYVCVCCQKDGARWWFRSSLMMKMMALLLPLLLQMMMITLVAKCAKDVWCKGISGAASLLRQSQRDQRRQQHKTTDLLCVCELRERRAGVRV